MNKAKFGIVIGSLAAGAAASAWGLMVAGTVSMLLLSRNAESSVQFSTDTFLQQGNLSINGGHAWVWLGRFLALSQA